jgi:hypothetical protein
MANEKRVFVFDKLDNDTITSKIAGVKKQCLYKRKTTKGKETIQFSIIRMIL